MTLSTLRLFFRLVLLVGAGLAGCSGESPEKLLVSANQYLAEDNPKAAIIQLKNVLSKSPDSAEARFLLGKALIETEDPVAAAIELGKASDLKYAADAVTPLMAKALLMQGEAKKVIVQYEAVILSSPAAAAHLKTTLAAALLGQHEFRQAETALQAAFQAVPGYPGAMLVSARLQASEGDMSAAWATLDQAIRKAPADAGAWALKGDFLTREGDPDKAIEAYKKALASRNDNLPAHVGIISNYLSSNNLKAAKEQLEELKKLFPRLPQTSYMEAQWAFKNGDYDLADALTQPLLKYGDNAGVLQLAGAVAMQKGALLQAETLFGKALKVEPDLPAIRRLLAQTYAKSGKPAKALETLAPLLNAKDVDAQTLSIAAVAHLQSGDAKQAEQLFGRATKRNPEDTLSRTALALMHLYGDRSDAAFAELESIADADSSTTADLALVAANLQRKNFAAALAAADRLEKKQPSKPLAPNIRGRILLAKADFDGARKSFEQALERDPVNFTAIEELAGLDLRDNKPELAEQRIDKLLAREPDTLRALMAKAQLVVRSGKSQEQVVALLGRAVKAHPNDAGPRLMLINHYMRQNDLKQALSTAQEAASALPSDLVVLDALGRAQTATGDFNQAMATYYKLAAALPNSPQVRVSRGDVYIAAGQKEEALRSLSEALQIEPDFLQAQERLVALHIDAGRRNEALVVTREVQKQRPKQAVGWRLEGDIQAAAKNWPSATSLYRIALEKETLTDIATKLHASLLLIGKRAEADAQAAQWIDAHPKDAAFLEYLGEHALSEQNLLEAEARFRQLDALMPDNAIVLNNLAWTTAKRGKPGALELAERANKLMPEQPALMDTLAMILAQGKNLPKAIEVQRKAVELQPQNGKLRLSLAQMYIDAGDKAHARKELEQLTQLGSKFFQQDEVEKLKAQL